MDIISVDRFSKYVYSIEKTAKRIVCTRFILFGINALLLKISRIVEGPHKDKH